MWTARALASERRRLAGIAWRIVESQSRVATMKIVDSLAEQELLEAELERSKPVIPSECAHLHWLLATPFRYAPYPHGSRFRRARQRDGCLYAAEHVETAIAEDAFYRLLFLLDAPTAIRPSNPLERTAFSLRYGTDAGIDLTAPPLLTDQALWMHPTSYGPCQGLADAARDGQVDAIRYTSVRDPGRRANLALLSCRTILEPRPVALETWHIMMRPDRVEAVRELPRLSLTFSLDAWAEHDERIPERMP